MKKDTDKLAKPKILFCLLILAALTTILFFETGILSKGGLTEYDTERYIIDVSGIFLTIGLIPFAIKNFSYRISKAKNTEEDVFLKIYRKESSIRLILLFVVIMTNIGLYYGTNDERALYCTLAGLMAFIYSFPGNRTMKQLREE